MCVQNDISLKSYRKADKFTPLREGNIFIFYIHILVLDIIKFLLLIQLLLILHPLLPHLLSCWQCTCVAQEYPYDCLSFACLDPDAECFGDTPSPSVIPESTPSPSVTSKASNEDNSALVLSIPTGTVLGLAAFWLVALNRGAWWTNFSADNCRKAKVGQFYRGIITWQRKEYMVRWTRRSEIWGILTSVKMVLWWE